MLILDLVTSERQSEDRATPLPALPQPTLSPVTSLSLSYTHTSITDSVLLTTTTIYVLYAHGPMFSQIRLGRSAWKRAFIPPELPRPLPSTEYLTRNFQCNLKSKQGASISVTILKSPAQGTKKYTTCFFACFKQV